MKPIVAIIIAMILFCDLTLAQDTLYLNKSGSVLWKQAVTDIDSVTFHKVYTAQPQGTVTDIDGNIYHTVTIGTQTWMVENLKTTHYRNGDPIPNITDNSAWGNLTTGAYSNYNNDAIFADTYSYGKLYNWYAVADIRNIAPSGWHVPTDIEWTLFINYLASNGYGYEGSGYDICKSISSTSGWAYAPSFGAPGNDQTSNNSTGFAGFPGGYRYNFGGFNYNGDWAYWWSSTEFDTYSAWFRSLYFNVSTVYSNKSNKVYGFSVRCLKDQ